MSDEIKVHIRWMIRRDYPEVLDIEAGSFEFPWTERDLNRCLRQRNCVGMVAEHDERIVAHMVYELHKSRLHVLTLAVDPEFRYRSIGRQMVDELKAKLAQQRRCRILLEVRDTNQDAQLFFREMGFRAISVLRGFYEQCDDDAYVFEYRTNMKVSQEDMDRLFHSE